MGTTFKAWLIGHIEQFTGVLFLGLILLISLNQEGRVWPDWIFSWPAVVPSFLIGLIPAAFAAKFTWDNFEEVISRSFKWRNSRVDILDKRMGYTSRIFFSTYFTVLLAVYCIEFSVAIWA